MRGSDSHIQPIVGVITALPREAQLFGMSTSIPSIQRLNSRVIVATSGIGDELARASAIALADMGVRAILSFGSAAGLSPDLSTGDLVLPKCVVSQTTGRSFRVTTGWHSALFQCLSLSEASNRNLAKTQGSMLQPSAVIANPADKAVLFQESKCIAADMESAGAAAICASRGLAFAAVRAITDDSDTAIPSCVLNGLDVQGNLSLIKLGLGLLKQPRQIFSLTQLGFGFAKAKHTLLAAISELDPNFAFPEDLQ